MCQLIFYRYQALFIPLSQHLNGQRRKIDRGCFKPCQLGTTHAGLVEHPQHQLVTLSHEVVGKETVVIEMLRLALFEKHRQTFGLLGGRHLGHDVGIEESTAAQETEPAAE